MNDYRITGPGRSPASPDPSRNPFAQPTMAAERQRRPDRAMPGPVSQAELREYCSRKVQLAELGRQHEAQRKRLLIRLKSGASVEPGRFGAEIRTSIQCQFTGPKLAKIIGPAEVERLKGLIGSTAQDQLWVSENS